MLEHLSVKNYVLIDKLELSFSEGLTVLTGETGSGKSIILGALSLILGAKGDKEEIRKGEKEAELSAVFYTENKDVLSWCEERGISSRDGEIIIRRVIKENGRGVYTINGTPITRGEGEEVGYMLVDFSSQNEHQSLLKRDTQLKILDDDSSCEESLIKYRGVYQKMKECEKELEELKSKNEKGKSDEEYDRYSLNELKKASLRVGEEDEIKSSLEKQSKIEKISTSLSDAISSISIVNSSLSSALSSLKGITKYDEALSPFIDRLESAGIDVKDIFDSLKSEESSLYFSEDDIENMNERLSLIQKMKRKYGGSEENCLLKMKELEDKLNEYENLDSLIDDKEKELNKIKLKALDEAEKLSEKRKSGALELSKRVEKTLLSLGMEGSGFRIEVLDTENLNEDGKNSVRYLLRANKGEKDGEIENVSSGGELSRIMLSIKSSLKSNGNIETLIFDEIDTGLGGKTAYSVADELHKLSKNREVIVITHLAQIASKGDVHFVVSKHFENGRTITSIEKVEKEERTMEIARLLSGDESKISLEHARELLGEVN